MNSINYTPIAFKADKPAIFSGKKEEPSTVIERLRSYITGDTFDYSTVNSLDKDAKEEFVKTTQRRINAKLNTCITASLVGLSGLIWGLVSGTPAGAFLAMASGQFTGLFMCMSRIHLKDKIKFMKSPLYKEYKASLPESTGLLNKAAKMLRK